MCPHFLAKIAINPKQKHNKEPNNIENNKDSQWKSGSMASGSIIRSNNFRIDVLPFQLEVNQLVGLR